MPIYVLKACCKLGFSKQLGFSLHRLRGEERKERERRLYRVGGRRHITKAAGSSTLTKSAASLGGTYRESAWKRTAYNLL